MNDTGINENAIKRDYLVAAVYGSPRRGGNTDLLLDSFLEGLENRFNDNSRIKDSGLSLNIEKFFVSELDISPCRECRYCSRNGKCIVNDQMQQIYPRITECDLLAIASPVFFTTVPGGLKSFIDRFQRFWALKYELGKRTIEKENKKGVLFCCAGSKPENIFDCTKKVMRSLFDVLYTDYFADFCFNNIDFMGDILKNNEMLDSVRKFGYEGSFIEKG